MRKSKKHSKLDENQIAASVIKQAISPKEEPDNPPKNPAAVALGKLGGLKGGKARAKKLSAERRRAIAKKAAETRWKKAARK